MSLQPDEPDAMEDEEDEQEAMRQEEAYLKAYETDNAWEQLQEDEHGNLRLDRTAEQRAKRRRLLSAAQSARIRKGMIRYLLLVIDMSRGASAQDLRPNRLSCMLRVCHDFVRDFFDQNPLSQLGVVVMRDGVARVLTSLSGSPEAQARQLAEANSQGAAGDASLQNALDMSVALLKHIPPYGHREVLFMFAALATCDPGNIFESIKAAKEAKVRVSAVGVAAEVYVCRRMAEETGGTYGVALSESHLEELMMAHAPPPPASAATAGAELVRMGFPQRSPDDPAAAVFVGPDLKLMAGAYTCPRCKSHVAELPCSCYACGLTLISSPHLARSYHHLFPVAPYEELSSGTVHQMALERVAQRQQAAYCSSSAASLDAGLQAARLPQESPYALCCFGCLRDLAPDVKATAGDASSSGRGGASSRGGGRGGIIVPPPMVLQCRNCRHVFCFDCDTYVHESLHNCPGCECGGSGAVAAAAAEDGLERQQQQPQQRALVATAMEIT